MQRSPSTAAVIGLCSWKHAAPSIKLGTVVESTESRVDNAQHTMLLFLCCSAVLLLLPAGHPAVGLHRGSLD
jgi:hypothetical protein